MADTQTTSLVPEDLPAGLPVMALRRGVLLPGVSSPFMVGRPRSLSALAAAHDGWLLVAAQREPVGDAQPSDLLPTAVLARVVERVRAPNGEAERAVLQGVARVSLTGFRATHPHLEATWKLVEEVWPDDIASRGMKEALRREVEQSGEIVGGAQNVALLLSLPEPKLVDALASTLQLAGPDWHREILTTHDPVLRAERVMVELVKAREALAARDTIQERVHNATRDQQREFLLRQQLRAIQEELGEGGDDELTRLRERLDDKELPGEVQEVVDRELKRLERLGNTSPERSVAMDWLEWIADMPWARNSAVDVDLGTPEEATRREPTHCRREAAGGGAPAVRQLAGSGRADVLLSLGPPGVGKTSIGQAIAQATGRSSCAWPSAACATSRAARAPPHLHRRVRGSTRIRRAGTADPVVLLDEVDKLGTGTWGDPASALLEILDPEQNHAFVDRYLEVPFDLLKVLFVGRPPTIWPAPGSLRDRMQLIDLPGYGQRDKLTIARDHLLPTVARNAGLEAGDVAFTDAALEAAIAGWTREAGCASCSACSGASTGRPR
ncbi:MAG: LON peptidase substrate-binding domain-containing protein [Myxococcota bacterium]